jgi:hypothetical protein
MALCPSAGYLWYLVAVSPTLLSTYLSSESLHIVDSDITVTGTALKMSFRDRRS